MENTEAQDVRTIDRGAQASFEVRGMTLLGEVTDYLGEGVYRIVDEDDNEHELTAEQFTVED